MTSNVTRREFVEVVAAASAMSLPAAGAAAAESDPDDDFSFLLLGDTHFDRIDHHDLDWMRDHFAKDIAQVENYCRHTKDVLPKLLAQSAESLHASELSSAFVLHVGDLVEGICGNHELAVRHCREAWSFIGDVGFGVPFVMTKGNHDITGPGSVQAYEEVLLRGTAGELGRDRIERTSFAFHRGENLFAIFDAYDRDAIDWLEQLVIESTFRCLFVLLHLPVVPYNARSNWRVYSQSQQAERRQRLIDLLGRHRAIVLSGHLHKYSTLVRQTRTGRFVQLAVSSIAKNKGHDTKSGLQGIESYGERLVDLEPDFDPKSKALRENVLRDEQPFIKHFEYAQQAGYAVVHVRRNGVDADVYHWPDAHNPARVALSELAGVSDG